MSTLRRCALLAIFAIFAVLPSISDADPPHVIQSGDALPTSWVANALTALRTLEPQAWVETLARSFRVARATRLYDAAVELPDTDATLVRPMVDAAIAEETPRAPAALLVAAAWGESRFDQRAQPLCGVLQVSPVDIGRPMSDCAAWRGDLQLAVRAGVTEIETMMADARVAGDLRRMLLYRACGNKAFDGTCAAAKYAWVEATIARYRQLEHAITRPTS